MDGLSITLITFDEKNDRVPDGFTEIVEKDLNEALPFDTVDPANLKIRTTLGFLIDPAFDKRANPCQVVVSRNRKHKEVIKLSSLNFAYTPASADYIELRSLHLLDLGSVAPGNR